MSDQGDQASDAELGRRVQILATEHWGLLAARSTAQSEVLSRITIFLTLVSAGLVTIGLLGQATGFHGWFPAAALGILGFLALVGALTQLRVMAVSEEDMMYVIAMNRLRGAYADVDAAVVTYFLDSIHDDLAGMRQTYSFLRERRGPEQILASSAFLTMLVNGIIIGLFVGALAATIGMTMPWAITLGVVIAAVVVTGSVAYAGANFFRAHRYHVPLKPTTVDPAPESPRV